MGEVRGLPSEEGGEGVNGVSGGKGEGFSISPVGGTTSVVTEEFKGDIEAIRKHPVVKQELTMIIN